MALEGTAQRVSALTHTLAEAARSRSLAHTPVLIFALAAGALVVLMLRT